MRLHMPGIRISRRLLRSARDAIGRGAIGAAGALWVLAWRRFVSQRFFGGKSQYAVPVGTFQG